jgi:hypothetical protein
LAGSCAATAKEQEPDLRRPIYHWFKERLAKTLLDELA